MDPIIIVYLNSLDQEWKPFGFSISTITLIATFLATIIAGLGVYLTYRQQRINLNVMREEHYLKEMDKLIKKLYINIGKYERFEPQHVDPNNSDEIKQASDFWDDIRENKYLAPEQIRNNIDQYLNLVSKHEQNIMKNRRVLSDILKERCKATDAPTILDRTSIKNLIKDEFCPMLGDKGLIKPIPIGDLQREKYLKTWSDIILVALDKNPTDALCRPAHDYFDSINNPLIGSESLTKLRIDLAQLVEERYKELGRAIENIKSNLEGKSF
jgi:hypothetical protein